MSNPSGVNGFTPSPPDIPYGDMEQNAAVQRSAPLAGAEATAQATNAPRRAQRSAARGTRQEAAHVAAPQLPGQPDQIAPQAQVAAFWAAVAAEPGASPLVQQIAQEATGGSQSPSPV